VVLVCLMLVLTGTTVAQEPDSGQPPVAVEERDAEWYREEARAAIRGEHYERALQLLESAKEHFPEQAIFARMLGDLYFERELYEPALTEYRIADRAAPGHYGTVNAIAVTLGRLNRERESVTEWERLVELYPDRVEPIHNLGWMYFKIHQLEAGEELLLDGIKRFGLDADLAMTLGTVYADMYEFTRSEHYYRTSIDLATDAGDDGFVSVAYYNLSLVEKAFYRFNTALESTNRSLSFARRPTGYLARGELHELRMDFADAQRDYLQAYALDEETPLPRINLAAMYQRFGMLDAARAHIEDVYQDTNLSWIYNFGTDRNRHFMDVHEILADTYEGLADERKLTPAHGLLGHARRLVERLVYAVKGAYHRMRFRFYANEVARALLEEGRELDGHWTFYQASEAHRRIAAKYLGRAEALETRMIPETVAAYQVERGVLFGEVPLLVQALESLSAPWENDVREMALRGVLEHGNRLSPAERAGAAGELYRLNPGAFRQYGLHLPVALTIVTGDGADSAGQRRRLRALTRYLRDAGLTPVGDAPAGYEPSELRILLERETLTASLAGRTERVTIAETDSRKALCDAVSQLAAALFRPRQ
jgi:tetratricopeptide (TPR) repeat protein